jgi:regulator of replication initiation timing
MNTKIINKISGKSDKKPIFRIEKDFSITNIEHIKQELNDLMEKNTSFHLELKNLDNFDLSSIQLLHAVKTKMKENFTFTIELKDENKTIIKHSGFEYLLNI